MLRRPVAGLLRELRVAGKTILQAFLEKFIELL